MEAKDNGKLERIQGVVKFFNDQKGFGFIARDGGGGDVFVHANALKKSGIDEIQQGDRLEFDLVPVEGKGPKAGQIKIIQAAS